MMTVGAYFADYQIMSYEEFLKQIARAGLTIREFAQLMRTNRISLSNYAKRGEVPSHLAVIAVLVGEMGERQIDFKTVLQSLTIEPTKPRGRGVVTFGRDRQRGRLK